MEMDGILTRLTDAIESMKIVRAPPPSPYIGYGDIADFFRSFEAYCLALYKQDFQAYLTVLPSFLEGEAKQIAVAYGSAANYRTVKDKIIEELSARRTLGTNRVTDILVPDQE